MASRTVCILWNLPHSPLVESFLVFPTIPGSVGHPVVVPTCQILIFLVLVLSLKFYQTLYFMPLYNYYPSFRNMEGKDQKLSKFV